MESKNTSASTRTSRHGRAWPRITAGAALAASYLAAAACGGSGNTPVDATAPDSCMPTICQADATPDAVPDAMPLLGFEAVGAVFEPILP